MTRLVTPIIQRVKSIDRSAGERAAAYTTLAVAMLYVVWLGRPGAIFEPGIPPRSDLGGHLVAIEHLVEASLPAGRLFDWSHQWFAGYPSFYFYFPLPALLIAALALVMPLAAAGKLVAIVSPALLPPATYALVRALGFGRLSAASAVLASVAFLSLTSQYIFGGNVLSSVIGEYSFAIGFALAFFYLSRVARAERGEHHLAAMTLLLAATALSHLIPTIFAVAGSLVAFNNRHARKQVVLSWLVAFGLAAFWAVPFLVRSPYMGSILWARYWSAYELFPLDVRIVAPWAVASAFALRRYLRKLRMLILLGVLAIALYSIPHGAFAGGRSLPLWHFVFYVWTGLGVAAGIESAWQNRQRWRLAGWVFGLAMIAGVCVIQMELVRSRAAGLLNTESSDAVAYDALQARLKQLPPGRLHWEFRRTDPDSQLLGARLALARVPAEISGMRTTQGLLTESAITSSAYMYLLANITGDSMGNRYWRLWTENDRTPERMRARLRQLGVGYFVTFSDKIGALARNAPHEFEVIARDSAWILWRVRNSALVEPMTRAPRLIAKDSWDSELASWLRTVTDTTPWPVYAPSHMTELREEKAIQAASAVRSALGVRRVAFTTADIGVPHIIRVSYFPNWRAYGADGPYLTVPGFMTVIPRQREVVLRFERTWVEPAGEAISLLTLLAFIVAGLRRSRRDRLRSARREAAVSKAAV